MSVRIRFARSMAVHDPALRLYAILDAESCTRRGLDMIETASAFTQGGVRLLQYRDKRADEATYLRAARLLRALLPAECIVLLNDHAHLVQAAGADGVHVGQNDLATADARALIGPERILGVSTHSADQVLQAHQTEADYIAVGPVFATTSKEDTEPTIGICGVQAARAVTSKPLVAIGGISLERARPVGNAGADSVAVISALLPSVDLTAITERTQDFLLRLK